MICVNPNSIEFKQILAEVGDPLYAEVEYAKRYTASDSKVNYQLATSDEIIASEKTLRDIAARMSDRIGIPVRFISDRTQEFKGKLQDGYIDKYGSLMDGTSAVVNLAYATLDTPIHEILGHPIIRAIKTLSNNKLSQFEKDKLAEAWEGFSKEEEITFKQQLASIPTLYKNLLKELETGRGKEVLDRVKRDYNIKGLSQKIKDNWDEGFTEEEYIEQYPDSPEIIRYSLEEQQEEAIVELLGMMTANKLDAVKDGKLISLLRRLLKEIKQFVKSLLKQREVEIDKLPDNMTIGDIADLLAYSNSKLILPGYEVEYTTPDNMKFKTYQEVSNHISQLAKSVEDVDLESVILPETHWVTWEEMNFRPNVPEDPYDVQYYNKDFINKQEAEKFVETLNQRDNVSNIEIKKTNESHNAKSFIAKNKEYEQSKEIIEEWKKVNNIQYNPEEIYSRGQEFVSVVGAYSSFDVNLMMQNLLQHIEDNEKAGGKFAISVYTKPVDKKIGHLEGGGGKIKFKIYPQSEDILWAANADVFSGSVWDASEKINKDKKSELLGVSYSKYPSLKNVDAVQPNLANIVDNLDHHHNELGISLTGSNFRLEYDEDIPYQTKKIINSINSILDQRYGKLVKPEIKQKEFGTKYIVKVESAYGDLNKSTIFNTEKEALDYKEYMGQFDDLSVKISKQVGIQPTQTNETLKESIDSVKKKYSIMEYSEEGVNAFNIGDIRYVFDMIEGRYSKLIDKDFTKSSSWVKITKEEYEQAKKSVNKEYTSQALINTKIAKLKEVAKKYPRSLIRSEVVRIEEGLPSGNWKADMFEDELPFQKIRSEQAPITTQPSTSVKEGVSELFESNPELANIGTPEQYSQYLDTKQPNVILPIGTSGSGKSTFIKSLPKENLVVIEPDAMRVEFTGDINNKSKDKEIYIEAANRAVQAIKQGKQVVFDTTNLTKDKRLPFIEAIKKAIPTVNIQYKLMELNPELAKQRIKTQIARGENRANVPDSTIDRHAESYKQMLEDIKNEPITEYKELGSKQDIEGFKKFTTRTTTQPTSLGGELSVYLSNKLKDEFGYDNPGNSDALSPLDILNRQVIVTKQDIDDKKLNC